MNDTDEEDDGEVASSSVTLMLRGGKKLIPVDVRPKGKKIALLSRYCKPLVDEFKCMTGAEWDGEAWVVTNNRRNWMQLEILQGRLPAEFVRYRQGFLPQGDEGDWDHQKDITGFILAKRRVIICGEPGVGKTRAAARAMQRSGLARWWWIAPTHALDAIRQEFQKWGVSSPRFLSYAEGGGGIKGVLEEWNEADETPQGVVFDESSRVKNPGSRTYKAARRLADAIRAEHDGFVVLMSGTPTPHDPCDIWAQAEIACPGYLRESSITHLKRRLAVVDYSAGYPEIKAWRDREIEILHQRLSGLMIVKLRKDCLNLPELTEEIVRLTPTDEVKRTARLLAMTCGSAIEALNKVRQLSDGFQYGEDGSVTRAASPKDDALRSILARNEDNGRIVVFADYQASVDRAVDVCIEQGWTVLRCDGRGWKVFPQDREYAGLLRQFDVDLDTHETDKLAFVGHPKSGGLGLNLTSAVNQVFYSCGYDAEAFWQGQCRVYRGGQRHPVTIYYLSHLPTDEFTMKNLKAKRDRQSIVMGEVLEVLK